MIAPPWAAQGLRVERRHGPELREHLGTLARLRTEVFREYPYLYDGSDEYEQAYLGRYLQAQDALIVLALDGDEVVGASSALPLAQETEDITSPFARSEIDPARVLYLGESVLRPAYRGRGLGHTFFDEREGYARDLGLDITTFCAVRRPEHHPRRPQPERTHAAFWAARGYVERPDLETTLVWKDLDEPAETPHPMRFWVRQAGG